MFACENGGRGLGGVGGVAALQHNELLQMAGGLGEGIESPACA